MTGEQLLELISDALSLSWGKSSYTDAIAVLRAIRAARIVMGERQELDSWLFHVTPGSKDYKINQHFVDDEGLALVRVVE